MCQDSRGEVQRLIDTFQIAAEEATRMYGEGLVIFCPVKAGCEYLFASHTSMVKRTREEVSTSSPGKGCSVPCNFSPSAHATADSLW